jgi:hypothetical protein
MATAAEDKEQYIAAMGEELGTQYAELWREIAELHLTWLEFVELFGTSTSRVELLNRAAPSFFRIVQDRLWEAVALHIARLTDPPYSSGRKDKTNLTIRNLSHLIHEPAVKSEVERLCDEALAASAFAREWRNRRIAHRDLDLALGGNVQPLEFASKQEVTAALEALAGIMNAIARRYLDSTTSFGSIIRPSGARNLLYVIDDGLHAAAARREQIKAGDLSPVYWPSKDI